MSDAAVDMSPAEAAAREAMTAVDECLRQGQSFRLEAGAGAGKTFTLVKALRRLIAVKSREFLTRGKQIACITYTNVARLEILSRVDRHPVVFCDTIHGFCWETMQQFQLELRGLVATLPQWEEIIEQNEDVVDIDAHAVSYSTGRRSLSSSELSLHHNDVLPLMCMLLERPKFRRVVFERFPVVFIDEYQDANADLVDAICNHVLGSDDAPQFGFFGDHWQRIYKDGCGEIAHESVRVIGKGANFRSATTIIDSLNRMRSELRQEPHDETSVGSVCVYHTNGWTGTRRRGGHWSGDLESDDATAALDEAMSQLRAAGWTFDPGSTKVLMLTHAVLASRQGYGTLPAVFRHNDQFAKKEHPHIAFFADVLEPACAAHADGRMGEFFEVLGGARSLFQTGADKGAWTSHLSEIQRLRTDGTVGQVVDCLCEGRRIAVPEAVLRRERERSSHASDSEEEAPRRVIELNALRAVEFPQITALSRFLDGHSPFQTKHGVKGAEFDDVLVVVGRGWNQYNFGAMLELAADVGSIPNSKRAMFERNRNLFYVACSRAKCRLALLFTQQLSEVAIDTITDWFGDAVLSELPAART